MTVSTPPDIDSAELLRRLADVPAAVLASALLTRGFRNVSVDGLTRLTAGDRMVGEAVTLRFVPAREDRTTGTVISSAQYPQRAAIEACGPGKVLVVDGRGVTSAAIGGEVYLTRVARLGAAGYVVDGSVRDSDGLRALDLPVYARSTATAPHHSKHVAADWNVTIGVGNVLVEPGDFLIGDEDGVTVVPRAVAAEVVAAAEELLALETFVLDRIREGAPLDGTFPPDEATRAAFAASRAVAAPQAD